MHNNILTIHLEIEAVAASDSKYQKEIKQAGGMFLSEIKNASSEKLYQLLKNRHILVNAQDIREATTKHDSAFDLLEMLKSDLEVGYQEIWDENICHLSLIFLWQRENAKNHPCLEFFDYYLYNGYAYSNIEDIDKALAEWYEAYKLMFYFIHRLEINSIDIFKNQMEGDYELRLWLEDYLMLLSQSQTPFHLVQQRTICEQFLEIFSKEENDIAFLIKMNYAQSFFTSGDENHGNDLYQQWLSEHPTWVQGWMGWADNYWINSLEKERIDKAIHILEKALKRLPFLETKEILLRLKNLYEREERVEDALTLAVELKKILDNEKEEEKKQNAVDDRLFSSMSNSTDLTSTKTDDLHSDDFSAMN